jgi:hypothetical protein
MRADVVGVEPDDARSGRLYRIGAWMRQHWLTIREHDRAIALGLIGCLFALVCLRSWVFVCFTNSHLDADQAVFGIMAKDIALGRAYPLFMYGRRYMLAIGAWLCAPLVAAFGSSVVTLKLPMFAMNIACVIMLWIGLRRERALGPWGTALAILPFAGTSVVLASRLVENCGGNIEPIFFLLLVFLLREHMIAFGIVVALAFLNREFALIGVLALLIMDASQGTLRRRLKLYCGALLIGVTVVWFVHSRAEGAAGYTGISVAPHPQNPFAGGLEAYFNQQLPTLLGLMRIDLHTFVTTHLHAGHDWLRYVAVLWAMLGIAGGLKLKRADLGGMACYLVLIGTGQAAAFILLCEAPHDSMLIRYVLLSICAWLGLTAFAWKTPALRPWIAAVVLIVTGSNVIDDFRLARQYAREPPQADLQVLTDALEARNVHYVEANFWLAYVITWLTDERIIASPPVGQTDRIPRYHEDLAQHPKEIVRISETPCPDGEQVLHWYLCQSHRNKHH